MPAATGEADASAPGTSVTDVPTGTVEGIEPVDYAGSWELITREPGTRILSGGVFTDALIVDRIELGSDGQGCEAAGPLYRMGSRSLTGATTYDAATGEVVETQPDAGKRLLAELYGAVPVVLEGTDIRVGDGAPIAMDHEQFDRVRSATSLNGDLQRQRDGGGQRWRRDRALRTGSRHSRRRLVTNR